MAAQVTHHVIEAVIAAIAYSPTTITGAGVTQHVVEAVLLDSGTRARVTQHVLEAVIGFNPDGSHGDTGGGGTPTPVTHSFGYAT